MSGDINDCKEAGYSFIKGDVPKFKQNDPEALSRIKNQLPVILTDCDIVGTALKWDLEYLKGNLGPGPFTVFVNRKRSSTSSKAKSKSTKSRNKINEEPVEEHLNHCSQSQTDPESKSNLLTNSNSNTSLISTTQTQEQNQKSIEIRDREQHHVFKYYDEKKVAAFTKTTEEFTPDIVKEELSFQEFLDRHKGDRSKERIYLQQPLNSSVGKKIAIDFVGFNWNWTIEKCKDWNWGPLTSNLLLIGQKGNITPCHYDEQQNLFCQLRGKKKFMLFSPENFPCLYPYPVYHPHDRQSQVDFDVPDLKRFPKFKDLEGLEAIVNPGEVLYIPMYWWHHVINYDDTIAINFWYKGGVYSPVEYPLKSRQKVAMIRNIEKMVLEALQDQDELSTLLHWLVDGRFDQTKSS